MYELRDMQKRALEDALDHIESKSKAKGIIVAPTSFGKSLVIANIAKELKERTIILQPNKELLQQNYEKYISYGNEASIYSASMGSKEIGDVTFATPGSVKNVADEFKKLKFRHVIIDECHWGSSSGMMISNFIKEINAHSVTGLTATPFIMQPKKFEKVRPVMMNKSRKSMFSKILHVTQIREMINNKYWSPLVYEIMNIDRDAYKLNTTGADFSHVSLVEGYKINDVETKIVIALEKLLSEGHKSILIFVPTVDQAERLSKIIRGSAVISDRTKKKERDEIIRKFKSLELPVVINCKILGIGFDHPELTGLIMARPISSVTLYYQMIGRAVRIHPNKEYAKIIDIAGNVEAFGRVEDFQLIESIRHGWELYSGKTQITNVPVDKLIINREKGVDDTKDLNAYIFTFGAHKGRPITAVRRDYLEFIVDNFDSGRWSHVIKAAKKELKRRQQS